MRIPITLVLVLACAMALAVDSVVVGVKKTSIRKGKQFFAPTVAEARYQERLIVLEQSGGWIKIKRGNVEGWIHKSAVAVKGGLMQSALKPKGDAVLSPSKGFHQDEIALAGKGFSEEVEQDYRRRNRQVNFAPVDWLQGQAVSDARIGRFAREGKLVPKEGQLAQADRSADVGDGAAAFGKKILDFLQTPPSSATDEENSEW